MSRRNSRAMVSSSGTPGASLTVCPRDPSRLLLYLVVESANGYPWTKSSYRRIPGKLETEGIWRTDYKTALAGVSRQLLAIHEYRIYNCID